jgi:hypothetical protein
MMDNQREISIPENNEILTEKEHQCFYQMAELMLTTLDKKRERIKRNYPKSNSMLLVQKVDKEESDMIDTYWKIIKLLKEKKEKK